MTKKNIENSFQKAFYGTPMDSAASVKARIMDECGISERTFYRWLENPGHITKLAKPIIAKILNKEVDEIFNNNPTTTSSIQS